MADKNSIDYQMYLDYLDGKTDEPKPETENISGELNISDNKEYAPIEKKLSRIEEIERKYHLDPGGEEKGVHLMTDEEFEQKYGSKNSYKKAKSREKKPIFESVKEDEYSQKPLTRFEEDIESDNKYEDVFSYNSENERSVPREELERAKYEAESELENEDEYGVKTSSRHGGKKGANSKKGKEKKKKWWKILLVVLLILGIAGGFAYAKRDAIIDFIGEKILHNVNKAEIDTGVWKQLEEGDDQNHGDIFYEDSADSSWSLEGWLDGWQKKEGTLMYNDKIVNVLLIGMDDPEGSTWGRSDSMILVSIDTIKQQLKLTSVWRDTYGLIQVPEIDNHGAYETHEKINGANHYGGPECTVDTIESLYKCRIDGYVMTTFESFKDLIDAMGGITVEVTETENDFLTRTAPVSWHASAGKNVLLNGKEALVYSRIRHLDSDIKRTERQRKVMSAMLDKIGELSTTQLFKTVTEYLNKGYVTTNFSQKDITQLGKKAVFGGWKDFEMKQMTAPISSEVDPENSAYYWGGTYNGAWVWVVDVPKTATDVQKFIYGETFCQLNDYRHSIAQFVSGGIN